MRNLAAVAVLAALAVAGCKRESAVPAGPNIDEAFGRIQEQWMAGQTNEAIAGLEAMVADDAFAQQRPRIFMGLLQMLLSAGRADEAHARFLDMAVRDASAGEAAFETLLSFDRQRGDAEGVADWTMKLKDSEAAPQIREQATAWYAWARIQLNDFDAVAALVDECLARYDDGACRRLLGAAFEFCVGAGQMDNASRLLTLIEEKAKERAPVRDMAVTSRVRLLTQEGKWDEAEKYFKEVAGRLSDEDLTEMLSANAANAGDAGRFDWAERVSEYVLNEHADKDLAWRRAAMRWVNAARDSGNLPAIAARMSACLDKGVPADTLVAIARRNFYALGDEANRAELKPMVELLQRLPPLLKDPKDVASVRAMLLDGSFLLKDYALSLDMLQQGIEDRDEAWHQMAINKVKAHKALADGNTDEAVKRFRDFMKYVSEQQKPEQDPVSGVVFTREMTLGRNAKRIGDILAEAGQADAAGKSYDEARQYYSAALQETQAGTPQHDLITKEMGAIPGATEAGAGAPAQP